MRRKAARLTHRQMVERWKKAPAFATAYADLETEFALLRQLLLARQRAGLSQAEVAKKMGIKAAGKYALRVR